MLPDWIIIEELKRIEQEKEQDRRPVLEIPRYIPYWPEPEKEEGKSQEEEGERGVIILQM